MNFFNLTCEFLNVFLLWFCTCFYEIELFWFCEWFFSWFDLKCEISWQEFINDK